MTTSLIKIHIPLSLSFQDSGYIYGNFCSSEEEHGFSVFGRACRKSHGQDYGCSIIGFHVRDAEDFKMTGKYKSINFIVISFEFDVFSVYEVKVGGICIDLTKCSNVICILYDDRLFSCPELLMNSPDAEESFYCNYVKTHAICRSSKLDDHSPEVILLGYMLRFFISIFQFLLTGIQNFSNILKYTTLYLHLENVLETIIWAFKSVFHERKISLKVGNFLIAFVVDILCGIWILHVLLPDDSPNLTELLLTTAKEVVTQIQFLLEWLMGIPAGLKLNHAFNSTLGKISLYHIDLWWIFLGTMKPVLDFVFQILRIIGYFGISYQMSILADLLSLVSFHIYCIYVFAARLYNIQVSALVALWRLFFGKKYNPLRGKVDSCEYSTNQLFVGTLAFTILLFLLPTTFMYYIVFTTLRLTLIGLGGLLTRLRFMMRALPLYVVFLWSVDCPSVISTISIIRRDNCTKQGPLILFVYPMFDTLRTTVTRCVADCIDRPPKVEWSLLLTSLISGKLIYPV